MTGFLGWKWGAKPAVITGVGGENANVSGLTVYTADLDLSSILGEVKASSEPRLVFDQNAGFVQARIDFASVDYNKVDKQLQELLGQPTPIIYELYKVDASLLDRSEWHIGSTVKVVLENRFAGAVLEISKMGFF